MTFAGVKKVFREVMSEPGGALSWGRVASSFSLVAAIAWVTHVMFKTGGIPSLDGITTFVVSPYAANKIGTAAQAFSQNPVAVTPPQAALPPPVVPAPSATLPNTSGGVVNPATLPTPPPMLPPT